MRRDAVLNWRRGLKELPGPSDQPNDRPIIIAEWIDDHWDYQVFHWWPEFQDYGEWVDEIDGFLPATTRYSYLTGRIVCWTDFDEPMALHA